MDAMMEDFTCNVVRLPSFSEERFWNLSQIETNACLTIADENLIAVERSNQKVCIFYFCVEENEGGDPNSIQEIGRNLARELAALRAFDGASPRTDAKPIVFVDFLSHRSRDEHDTAVACAQALSISMAASWGADSYYLVVGVSHDDRVAPALSCVAHIAERVSTSVVVSSRSVLLGLGKGNDAEPDAVEGCVQSMVYLCGSSNYIQDLVAEKASVPAKSGNDGKLSLFLLAVSFSVAIVGSFLVLLLRNRGNILSNEEGNDQGLGGEVI